MSQTTINKETDTRPRLADQEARQLVCDLCRHFYELGWATGTGGGISIRSADKIYMAPSGVQKEKLKSDEIFVLDMNGECVETPSKNLTVSACKPLFMHAYRLRNAGAVLHSHSINAMLATLLFDKTFQITGVEMQKGIQGAGVFDFLEVPIIENTAYESQLADSLEQAILAHPKTYAVLVKGHGVYVWGKDWVQAKTQAEAYEYLFEAAVKMKSLGIDPTKKKGGVKHESILARYK